jgi:hypothetical protein
MRQFEIVVCLLKTNGELHLKNCELTFLYIINNAHSQNVSAYNSGQTIKWLLRWTSLKCDATKVERALHYSVCVCVCVCVCVFFNFIGN